MPRSPRSRKLSLDDIAPNFRDLGDLTTPGGRRLAPRRLLRCSALGSLSKAGEGRLRDYLPSAVYVDLRTDEEVRRDGPPTLPHTWTWRRMPVRDSDVGTPIRPYHVPRIVGRYHRAAVRIAWEALQTPVVVACSLGKDRTGFVIALLLQWLGVARKDILDDFVLSDLCLRDARSRLAPRWRDPRHAITPVDVDACARLLDFVGRRMPPRQAFAIPLMRRLIRGERQFRRFDRQAPIGIDP
jgi:protein-tyrosine phosphatase family protein